MSLLSNFRLRDLRLTMLKSLKAQHDATANEKILQMEAKSFGLSYTREVIRQELKYLESLQAIKLTEAGSVMIATLKRRGEDHLERLVELEGVDAPSLEA
jgi:hypothetical protein